MAGMGGVEAAAQQADAQGAAVAEARQGGRARAGRARGCRTPGLWSRGFWTLGLWTQGFLTQGFWTLGFWTLGFWTLGFWTLGGWAQGGWAQGGWAQGGWAGGVGAGRFGAGGGAGLRGNGLRSYRGRMKRHLTLHIGLSKTGSSSIQRVLAEQRPAMQARGIYYPRSPGWANHALLPASLVNDPRILWGFHPGTWEGLSPAARLARFRQEWAAEMAALPDWAGHVVISAEQIGGLMRQEDEVQRLADTLHAHFATVRVVVYLRRQDQHLASAYSQWLRGGVLEEPALPATGPAHHFEYDYGPMLDRYARAFGDAAMCPRIFSRATLVAGDVVEDFFAASGFSLPIPPEAPNKNANLGISLEGQALMLMAGRSIAAAAGNDAWRDQPSWRRFAEAVSERFPGRGWRPTRAEALAFLARFEATNEHARRRFFPERETLFDMDVSDLPEQAERADPARLGETAMALALYEMERSALREAEAALGQYRLMKRLGDRRGMRTTLVRAVKYAPDMLLPRLCLADWFIEEGDALQAQEHLQAAARIAPEDPKVKHLQRRAARGPAVAAGRGLDAVIEHP